MDAAKREAIAARLARIASLNGGRLTPDAVLQDAESAKSPLHDQFEWDDSAAAVQWRLMQARELIRSVKVEVQMDSRIVSTVRYVRDPTAGDQQGYVDTAKLRNDVSLARDALLSELTAIHGRVERANSLAVSLGLEGELDELKARVEMLRGKAAEAA